MQIFMYAMPAIAFYVALTANPYSYVARSLSGLLSLALLVALLVALARWRRRRTVRYRNMMLLCSVLGFCVGYRPVCEIAMTARIVYAATETSVTVARCP